MSARDSDGVERSDVVELVVDSPSIETNPATGVVVAKYSPSTAVQVVVPTEIVAPLTKPAAKPAAPIAGPQVFSTVADAKAAADRVSAASIVRDLASIDPSRQAGGKSSLESASPEVKKLVGIDLSRAHLSAGQVASDAANFIDVDAIAALGGVVVVGTGVAVGTGIGVGTGVAGEGREDRAEDHRDATRAPAKPSNP